MRLIETMRENVVIREQHNRTQRAVKCHLTDPVDRRLARMIARSMQIPGRHGFEVLFREFMQRGYEAACRLPKTAEGTVADVVEGL